MELGDILVNLIMRVLSKHLVFEKKYIFPSFTPNTLKDSLSGWDIGIFVFLIHQMVQISCFLNYTLRSAAL